MFFTRADDMRIDWHREVDMPIPTASHPVLCHCSGYATVVQVLRINNTDRSQGTCGEAQLDIFSVSQRKEMAPDMR